MNKAPNYGPGDVVVPTECMETGQPGVRLPPGKYIVQSLNPVNAPFVIHCDRCGREANPGVIVYNGRTNNPFGYFPCKFRLFDPRENDDDALAIVRQALADLRLTI